MNTISPIQTDLTIEEIVNLCAADGNMFMRTFFPRTARQEPPPCHKKIWQLMDSRHRLVNVQVFRGGAKTSIARGYTAKRIAYGLAKTILYIGKSEGHAVRSVSWLRNQIETNEFFSGTFGLRKGGKWADVETEIEHTTEGHKVWVMAMGITGSIRGINRDDFRPDLIVLDDVIDDENAATMEQREKVETRIYGAVKESLAPASECPDAKMVMLQTPIHREDASVKALKDGEWVSAVHGCWTPETMDLPIEHQRSAWPARWPDEVLRREKRLAYSRNKGSIWAKEKECKLISPETVAFKANWLNYYDKLQLPEYGVRVLVVDPVPPPSPKELESGMITKDFESLHVVQRTKDNYYSVESRAHKGHDPSWTIANLFELAETYNVRKIMIESVNYQRTLAWLFRQAMEKRSKFWQVHEFTDPRSKFNKIVDSLNGIASEGRLFVKAEQTTLISQFTDYPRVSHDDELETLALGVMELSGAGYTAEMFQDVGVESSNHGNAINQLDYMGAP